MNDRSIKSVEQSKAASDTCKRLFPSWFKPPTQGELQKIIVNCWAKNIDEKAILRVGNWWLWIRNILIENAITKTEKDKIINTGIQTASGEGSLHLVSARSPELLHAQVTNQGDRSLPRSRHAIRTLAKLVKDSSAWLPTKAIIIFADLAIDNIDNIRNKCDVEELISENTDILSAIAQDEALDVTIIRMSKLNSSNGLLGNIVNIDGTTHKQFFLDNRAEALINIAAKESLLSHKRMFGWNTEQSTSHTRNLGIVMGLVGQAIKVQIPRSILFHNEAFISRGRLNNIFNSPNDPLPVICLRELLESKKPKS